MTNLYETLGVRHTASFEEIEDAYMRLSKFFNPDSTEPGNTASDDPTMKIYFADLTLAYSTLVNKVSRAEYDEYIS